MIDIYQSTGGEYWFHRWDTSTNPCFEDDTGKTWYGVKCKLISSSQYTWRFAVFEINLSNNNLSGILPGSLSKLSYLNKLIASSNTHLTGALQDIISSTFGALTYLDLSFCGLSGEITEQVIVFLGSLVELRLCCQRGNYKINGTIPKNIGDLLSLKVLSLGGNAIKGPIPASLAKLQNLEILDLEDAQLNEELDANVFQNMANLKSLNMSNTNISGTLTGNISNFLPNIEELLLLGNNLYGCLPQNLSSMRRLRILNLAYNKLTCISQLTRDLESVEFVDLSHNRFNITQRMFENFNLSAPKLKTLLLSDNAHLSVQLKYILRNPEELKSLTVLNISNCNISGPIPSKLWSFDNLIYVDLSGNKLNGCIPEMETSMLSLLYLDVSNNFLKGCIPITLSRVQSLQNLRISGNKDMVNCNVPSFVKPLENEIKLYRDGCYYCPMYFLSNGHGKIELDPSYYNYAYCKCRKGCFGDRNVCRKCFPRGVCKSFEARSMVIPMGYWPAPSPANATHLVKCNDRADVFKDREMTACNPNGLCKCTMDIKRNITVCNTSCICREGSHGRMCSQCQKRWYTFGAICLKCPSNHFTVYLFVGLAVGSLLIFLAALLYLKTRPRLSLSVMYSQLLILMLLRYFHVIPGWIFEMNFVILLLCLAGIGDSTRGLLKIAVFYFQILDAMISNYNRWPKLILLGQRYVTSLINFQFPGLACDLPPDLYTPTGKFVALLILPLTCITAVWLMYLIVVACYRNASVTIKCHCMKSTVMCLRLTYFPIVLRSFAIVASCTEDRYMRNAPWVACSSKQSTKLRRLAWLSTGLYVMGVPLLVFLPLLLRFVRRSKRALMSNSDKEVLDRWLGCIYLPYKEKYRSFWEVYALLRQLVIAFIIGYYKQMSPWQTFLVSLVLVVALVVHAVLQPYQSTAISCFPMENVVETAVLVVLQHSFILLRFTMFKSDKKSQDELWMIVAVNGLLVVFLCGLILLLIIKGTVNLLKTSSNHDEEGVETSSKTIFTCFKRKRNRMVTPLLKPDDIN